MKALLAKIPRERSLLLLLAPPLVLVAFLAAGRSPEQYSALPVGVAVTTTTTTAAPGPFTPEGAAAQAAEVEGSSVSRSGTTTGSRSSGGSSGTSSGRSSGGNSSELADGVTTSAAPAEVQGDAETATTTTVPGETTTTTAATTTTTVPDENGPEPAVDESPIAILLPISALVVLGLALFVIIRRRRPPPAQRA